MLPITTPPPDVLTPEGLAAGPLHIPFRLSEVVSSAVPGSSGFIIHITPSRDPSVTQTLNCYPSLTLDGSMFPLSLSMSLSSLECLLLLVVASLKVGTCLAHYCPTNPKCSN